MSATAAVAAFGNTPAKHQASSDLKMHTPVVPPTPATPSLESSDQRIETAPAATPLAATDTMTPPPTAVPELKTMAQGTTVSSTSKDVSRRRKLEFRQQSPGEESDLGTPAKPPLTERQQLALLLKGQSPTMPARADSAGSMASASSVRTTPGAAPGVAVLKDKKVNQRNRLGETVLQRAAIKGDVAQVKRLIGQGAEVNTHDNAGWTPLHEAANHGHADVAEALLQAGALPNARGMGGETPLHDAVVNDHMPIVRLLIRYGADITQLNEDNESALDKCDEGSLMHKYLEAKLNRGPRRVLRRGKENKENAPPASQPSSGGEHAEPRQPIRVPLAPLPTSETHTAPASPAAATPLKQPANPDAAQALVANCALPAASPDAHAVVAKAPETTSAKSEIGKSSRSDERPADQAPAKGAATGQPRPPPLAAPVDTPMAGEDNVTYQSRDRVQKVVIQRQAPAKPANGKAVQSKPTAQSAPAADLLPNKHLAATSEASRQPPMPRSSPAPQHSPPVPTSSPAPQPSPPMPTSLPAPQPMPANPAPAVPQKAPEPPTSAPGTGHRKHKIVRFAAGSTPKPKPRRAEKTADDRHKARKRDALLALADQLDAERADSLAKRQKVQGCAAALADGSLPDELAALLKDMAEERSQLALRQATERRRFEEMVVGQAKLMAASIPDNWVDGATGPRPEAVAAINVNGYMRGTSACRHLTKQLYGCLSSSTNEAMPIHAAIQTLIQAAAELTAKQRLESATLQRRQESAWDSQAAARGVAAACPVSVVEVPAVTVTDSLYNYIAL